MSRKSLRWRDSDVILFLEYYKQLPCLWNNKVEDYKDRFKRKKAYEALRNNMDLEHLTIMDVKNKIKGIRTTYSDELNKIVHSEKYGNGEIYEPKVFWFKLADTFLRGVTERRKNFSAEEVIENTSCQNEDDLEPGLEQEQMDDSDTEESSLWIPKSERSSKRTKSIIAENPIQKPKLARFEEDEFDLFGRSIAMQLKKLPELEALQLMHKMQSMVIDKKMELDGRASKSFIYVSSEKAVTTAKIETAETSTSDPLNYNCHGISSLAGDGLYAKFEMEEPPDSVRDHTGEISVESKSKMG